MKSVSLARGVVVLLAAAIIATGLSVAGYAVSSSRTNRPTTITNSGQGPALVLRNRPAYPPLQVSSGRKVLHFNADRLDGKDSSQLEPNTMRWSIGSSGQQLAHIASFVVRSGWYEVSLHVVSDSTDADPHEAQCFVYPQLQVETGDYSNLISAQTDPAFRNYVSLAGDIFIPSNDRLLVQCYNDGGADAVHLTTPITLTVRPVTTIKGPVPSAARTASR